MLEGMARYLTDTKGSAVEVDKSGKKFRAIIYLDCELHAVGKGESFVEAIKNSLEDARKEDENA